MSLEDTTAIAKQLAFEMNIPYGSYLHCRGDLVAGS